MKATALLLAYALSALFITAAWTRWAETEKSEYRFNSIVAIADGTAGHPFNKRRALVDGAQACARLVPGNLWAALSGAVDDTPVLKEIVRHTLGWPREHDPLLFTVTGLIWLSVTGFMYGCRWLVAQLYEVPQPLADFTGLVLGFALLGGGGDGHYYWYPYDFPHAFLFVLTLNLLISGNPLALVAFLAAAYSKETAILLIPAALLVARNPLSWRVVLSTALMAVVYVTVRGYISTQYDTSGPVFWWLPRNVQRLLWWVVFDHWELPVLIVCVVRLAKLWDSVPVVLRRLVVFCPLMLGLCFFKGWIEEKRAFLELLPVLGTVALQWVFTEVGFGSMWKAKVEGPTLGLGWRPVGSPPEPAESLTPVEVARAASAIYRQVTGFRGLMMRLRPHICPLHTVLEQVPVGSSVVDIGCGMGLLAGLLGRFRGVKRYLGLDIARKDVEVAAAVYRSTNPGFQFAEDLGKWPEPEHATVLCVDVLHHVPPAGQQQFVHRLAGLVPEAGRLVIKDLSGVPFWKAWMNRLHDLLVARQWVRYVESEDVARWVEGQGLTVVEMRRHDVLWYAHYFLVAERPSPAQQAADRPGPR